MLKLNKIRFRYDNADTMTLDGISIALENGEVMAVVGPSGGGKSTLLRIISGLEKPFEGTIDIDGQSIVDKNHFVKPEKRGVGMLFQDYALFPHMTVAKNIGYGIDYLSGKERKSRIKEMLQLVDMEGYGKRYPHELSGGQQQRIALARAIAPEPKILLLDEPFSNLDTQLLEKVREELFEIIRSSGITAVMVTHNPEDARTQADKIVSIVEGKIDAIDYRQPEK